MKTYLFNPYTGVPRHAADIDSDPQGLLIVEPGAPLIPASADHQVDQRERELFLQFMVTKFGDGSPEMYEFFNKRHPDGRWVGMTVENMWQAWIHRARMGGAG